MGGNVGSVRKEEGSWGHDRDRHEWRAVPKGGDERKGGRVGGREKKERGKKGKKKGGRRGRKGRVCYLRRKSKSFKHPAPEIFLKPTFP